MDSALGDSKVDAVVCVAGGWAGGNAASDGLSGTAQSHYLMLLV